jgi:NAD(P)-dependent dehydrogenase (short-subunit alcohol dehydrogenase family)
MCATSQANLTAAQSSLEAEVPDVKGRILTTIVDITQEEQVRDWIARTVAFWGQPLDGAANVAARMNDRIWPVEDTPVEDLRMLLEVNVVGTFTCMQHELRNMRPGGSLVNVGSQQLAYAGGLMGAYAASKNALRGLTRAAAYEAGESKGIRVNMLCPGTIDTDMIRQPLMTQQGVAWTVTEDDSLTQIVKRFSKPEEQAAAIAFLLGDESKFVTRQEWYVDGGWCEGNYVAADSAARRKA